MSLAVKVAGVLLGLKVGNELGLLPQQPCPVQVLEEGMLLHLKGPTCHTHPTHLHMQAHRTQNTASVLQKGGGDDKMGVGGRGA